MVLDLMFLDIVRRTCQGGFVATSGRSYWGGNCSGGRRLFPKSIEVLTGAIGDTVGWSENAAVCFCTSRYVYEVPECLIARHQHRRPVQIVNRLSRTSIDLGDARLRHRVQHQQGHRVLVGMLRLPDRKDVQRLAIVVVPLASEKQQHLQAAKTRERGRPAPRPGSGALLAPFSVILTGPLIAVSLLRRRSSVTVAAPRMT